MVNNKHQIGIGAVCIITNINISPELSREVSPGDICFVVGNDGPEVLDCRLAETNIYQFIHFTALQYTGFCVEDYEFIYGGLGKYG